MVPKNYKENKFYIEWHEKIGWGKDVSWLHKLAIGLICIKHILIFLTHDQIYSFDLVKFELMLMVDSIKQRWTCIGRIRYSVPILVLRYSSADEKNWCLSGFAWVWATNVYIFIYRYIISVSNVVTCNKYLIFSNRENEVANLKEGSNESYVTTQSFICILYYID